MNVSKPTSARYPLSGKVICGLCGAHYNRRTRSNGKGTPKRIVWQCLTYAQKGKAACASKQIPEETLLALACEVLGVREITEENIGCLSEIRIHASNSVAFIFADGHAEEKVWQDRSRAESWTDEMRKRASEQMKRRHSHE